MVLVTGGIYISSGELVKVCPYSSTIEMVIKGMKLPYKVVCVDFTAKKKEDWFVDIHKDGKPTTPCMRIDDEWVFDGSYGGGSTNTTPTTTASSVEAQSAVQATPLDDDDDLVPPQPKIIDEPNETPQPKNSGPSAADILAAFKNLKNNK